MDSRALRSLAAVPLPDSTGPVPDPGSLYDPLQRTLYERLRIEVPVFTFPEHPRRLDYDAERGRIGGYPGGGAYAAIAYNVGYARAMLQAAMS